MPDYEQIDRQKYQKQITELQEQNQKLIEALEGIANLYSKYDEGGMISQGKTMKRIAQQALDEVDNNE